LIHCLLLSFLVSAFDNSNLDIARDAYYKANYEQTVVYLTNAIDEGSLNNDQLAEAHLLRGQAFLEMLADISANGKLAMLEIKRGISIKCYSDLLLAGDLVSRNKPQVDALLDDLYIYLMQEGLTLLSRTNNKGSLAISNSAKESLSYFDAAAQIRPDAYEVYKYRAEVYSQLGDEAKELQDLLAASNYILNTPQNGYPDFDKMAMLMNAVNGLNEEGGHRTDEALNLLDKTRKLVEKDNQVFEETATTYSPEETDIIREKFAGLFNQIDLRKYEILLKSELNQQATIKELDGQKELPEITPEKLVEYGDLLTDISANKALSFYKQAIHVDETYFDAYEQASKLIYNEALKISEELSFETDYQKQLRLQKEYHKVLEMTIPYLNKALELQPDNKMTLAFLKEAYFQLDMMPQFYQVQHQLTVLE